MSPILNRYIGRVCPQIQIFVRQFPGNSQHLMCFFVISPINIATLYSQIQASADQGIQGAERLLGFHPPKPMRETGYASGDPPAAPKFGDTQTVKPCLSCFMYLGSSWIKLDQVPATLSAYINCHYNTLSSDTYFLVYVICRQIIYNHLHTYLIYFNISIHIYTYLYISILCISMYIYVSNLQRASGSLSSLSSALGTESPGHGGLHPDLKIAAPGLLPCPLQK